MTPRTAIPVQFRALPPTTLRGLVGLNLLVFVLWTFVGSDTDPLYTWAESNLLVSGTLLADGRIWTLLTSGFSHFGLTHLLFNMYALWLFGRDVETIAGHRGMVHLYVLGAVVASLTHVMTQWIMGTDVPALGASGAVMAIAVAHAALFPMRRVAVFFLIPMPLWLAVAGFIFLDVAGLASNSADGVAHGAHLGGAVAGWVYFRQVLRPRVAKAFRRQWGFSVPPR
ncbi:MAG: rhomboid family intramembrane serine protease [Myxococcota bacterium]